MESMLMSQIELDMTGCMKQWYSKLANPAHADVAVGCQISEAMNYYLKQPTRPEKQTKIIWNTI